MIFLNDFGAMGLLRAFIVLGIVFAFHSAWSALTPELVSDIRPGTNSSTILGIKAYGERVVFSAIDGTHGREPWITDGTDSGTTMIKDLVAGSGNSDPGAFFQLGNKMLFTTVFHELGSELWITDGTDAGTTILKDINLGGASSEPLGFVNVGNTTVFIADDGGGRRVFKTDGTSAGTIPVPGSPAPTGLGAGFIVHNGWAYASYVDSASNSSSIWRTDGNTVVFVKGYPSPQGIPYNMISSYGYLYYTIGNSLVRTNGTEAGTATLANIGSTLLSGSFINYNGSLYMSCGAIPASSYEPYKWDGNSVTLLKDIYPFPGESRPLFQTIWRNRLFFTASTANSNSQKLFVTDGTAVGTRVYSDFGSPASFSSSGFVYGWDDMNFALINADSPTYGREFWITYSPDEEPTLLLDLWAGPSSANPGIGPRIGNTVYMLATDAAHGRELWKMELPVSAAKDWEHYK